MLPKRVECWSCHEKHWITPFTYIVCFECGHPYTKRQLVKADHRIRLELSAIHPSLPDPEEPPMPGEPALDLLENWPRPRKAEHIYSCPCCIHDFL